MSSIYDKSSLVLIPSGTKTSKVYSQKPTNGDGDFDFTRSTAATRVNADGNIEKETQNLVTYSNTFSNAIWNASAGSVFTSGQAGYDGSNDAWKLASGGSGTMQIVQTTSNTSMKTHSIYAKAGSVSTLKIWVGSTKEFDLSAGTTSSTDSKITDVGGGWYRCEVFNIFSNLNPFFTAASAGDYIYVQDAQLNQGLIAQEVITTTTTALYGGITDNVPRLDYTDSSCPALLLEPQRTNLVTQSEYFASWYQSGATTNTNNAISPDGTLNASLITIPSGGYGSVYTIPTSISGTTYTSSVYGKKGNQNYLSLEYRVGAFSGNVDAVFDLNTGVVPSGTGIIEDVGNGWYRCSVTKVSTSSSALLIIGRGISGSSNDTVYLYGAETEAGSYATSYIPTYGTSVTRNVDTAINNNNTSLPTSYPFTLYSEMDVKAIGDEWGVSFLDVSANNKYYVIGVNSIKKYSMLSRNNTASSVQSTANATEGTHKICGVFTETTLKLFVDGVLLGSSNNAQSLASAANDLLLGQLRVVSDTQIRNTIHQSLVFNQALTDQEAIDLTTI